MNMNGFGNLLRIFAIGVASVLSLASCGSDDEKIDGKEEYTGVGTQFLQLALYNLVEMGMDSSDKTFTYSVTVERQGKDVSSRQTASLDLWGESEMRQYNAEEGHSYDVLPASLFTIESTDIVLEEGEAQKSVTLSLDPSAVFEEMKKTKDKYAIGMTLVSDEAKIVSSRRKLVLALSVSYPTLGFDMPPVAPSVSLHQEATEVEIPTLFTYDKDGENVGCPMDFTCKLLVPDNAAELVAEYNRENNSSHELLPSDSYVLGDPIHYNIGEKEASGIVTVFRDKLGVTTYLLPLVLAEPSSESVLCSDEIYYVSFGQTYSNPVLSGNHPDPAVLHAPDGNFYLYCTEGSGNDGGMGIYRSSDLLDWEHVGNVIKGNYLSWADLSGSNGDLWAPEARYINGKYYVYFSVSAWGGLEGSKIGVATCDSPTGPFTDSGKALITYDDLGVMNSIDPFYWEEDGKKYLFWGSFHGIYVTELTDDGLSVRKDADGNPALLQKVAGSAFEATCIYKKDGYYYLMASVGSCCDGEDSSYRVVVGRSTSLFGPYVDKNGGRMLDNKYELVVDKNAAWVGPGHNSQILTDDAGNDWMIYHGRPMPGAEVRAVLLDRLRWTDDGWPYVLNGSPSAEEMIPVFN